MDLAPDLVLTRENRPSAPGAIDADPAPLKGFAGRVPGKPAIISFNPKTMECVLDQHLVIGRAAGLEARAARVVFELRTRMVSAESFVNPYTEGPVVGFLQSTEPLVAPGGWIVPMIERAGGRHPLNASVPALNAGAAAGMQAGQKIAGPPVRAPVEVFLATRPEFLIICPVGLPLARAMQEARALRASAPWLAELPAARAGRVAVVDGVRTFHRPGPGLVDAFEWLVAWLNDRPERMPAGFPFALLD